MITFTAQIVHVNLTELASIQDPQSWVPQFNNLAGTDFMVSDFTVLIFGESELCAALLSKSSSPSFGAALSSSPDQSGTVGSEQTSSTSPGNRLLNFYFFFKK